MKQRKLAVDSTTKDYFVAYFQAYGAQLTRDLAFKKAAKTGKYAQSAPWADMGVMGFVGTFAGGVTGYVQRTDDMDGSWHWSLSHGQSTVQEGSATSIEDAKEACEDAFKEEFGKQAQTEWQVGDILENDMGEQCEVYDKDGDILKVVGDCFPSGDHTALQDSLVQSGWQKKAQEFHEEEGKWVTISPNVAEIDYVTGAHGAAEQTEAGGNFIWLATLICPDGRVFEESCKDLEEAMAFCDAKEASCANPDASADLSFGEIDMLKGKAATKILKALQESEKG